LVLTRRLVIGPGLIFSPTSQQKTPNGIATASGPRLPESGFPPKIGKLAARRHGEGERIIVTG
jgi:hypothetical protein